MRKVVCLAAVLLLMVFIGTAQAAEYIQGHKIFATAFDAVTVITTSIDTTEWKFIGDHQKFTYVVWADSVGGVGVVDIDIAYEIAGMDQSPMWEIGASAATVFISGFTGYNDQKYYKPLECPPAMYIRFIREGTASNGSYSLIDQELIRQP